MPTNLGPLVNFAAILLEASSTWVDFLGVYEGTSFRCGRLVRARATEDGSRIVGTLSRSFAQGSGLAAR